MKAKTIKSVIHKKVNDWLESIEDSNVREIAEKNTIVTGGCIASMFLNEPPKDFDIYFRTKVAAVAVAEYYVSRFEPAKKKGIEVKVWVETTNP